MIHNSLYNIFYIQSINKRSLKKSAEQIFTLRVLCSSEISHIFSNKFIYKFYSSNNKIIFSYKYLV